MISTLKKNGNTYYCSNCLMRQFELKPNCPFCGNMFSNYETLVVCEKEIEPPEIIIGGRWWEEQEPEEELTDKQKELLNKLSKAVKELRDSIFEGDNENESNIH